MFLSLYKCPEWIMTLISIVFVILLLLFYSKKIKFKNILYINFIQILFLFKSLLLCFCLYVISTPIHCLLFDVDGLLICKMCFVSLGNLCLILSDSINAQLLFFYFKGFLVAPVLEEVLYRGLLQKYLYKTNMPFVAILIGALLFSFSHFDMDKVFITFFPGLLYGFVYYKSDSLIIPILCHSFWNILCSVFLETIQCFSAYNVLFYLLAIFGFVLLFRNIWKFNVQKLNNE